MPNYRDASGLGAVGAGGAELLLPWMQKQGCCANPTKTASTEAHRGALLLQLDGACCHSEGGQDAEILAS